MYRCIPLEGDDPSERKVHMIIDGQIESRPRDRPEEHPSYLHSIIKTPNGSPIEKVYSVLTCDEQLPSPTIFRGTATYTWSSTRESVCIRVRQHEEFERKRKPIFRMLMFFLQKAVALNHPDVMSFSLQELVTLGMFTRASSARRAVQEFARVQSLISIEYSYKRRNHGREELVTVTPGALFANIETSSKSITCVPNNDLISRALCTAYTILPHFVFGLNDNAYALTWYIFYLSRQRRRDLAAKGYFNISLDALRRRLGLPSADNVRNREYKKLIIDPILAAIGIIQERFASDDASRGLHISIEVHGCSSDNIREWLQGYVTIQMDISSSTAFQNVAKREEQRKARLENKRKKAREQVRGGGSTAASSAH